MLDNTSQTYDLMMNDTVCFGDLVYMSETELSLVKSDSTSQELLRYQGQAPGSLVSGNVQISLLECF